MQAISEGFEQPYMRGYKVAWDAEEQGGEPSQISLPVEALGSGRPAQGVPSGPQWLSLPAAPESVRRARRFTMDVLSEVAETDSVHVDDVVLVVSELVTNAVREVAEPDPVGLGIAVHPRWTHLYAPNTESGPDPVMVDDAARLYDQGWAIRQVAARFETSYGAMRRVLQNHTTLRPRGGGDLR